MQLHCFNLVFKAFYAIPFFDARDSCNKLFVLISYRHVGIVKSFDSVSCIDNDNVWTLSLTDSVSDSVTVSVSLSDSLPLTVTLSHTVSDSVQ